MSNVLYTCPGTHDPEAKDFDADNTDCGARLFAAPGGTKIKCRHHAEAKFIQREDGPENLFLYTEDKGKAAGKGKVSGREGTALGTPLARAEIPKTEKVTLPGSDVNPDGTVVFDPHDLPEDVIPLRAIYEQVFGYDGSLDKRWGAPTLTTKIQVELERQAAEEEAQQEAQKADSEIKAEDKDTMTENQVDVPSSDDNEEE